MRKNMTHDCAVPQTRNDLIDMINERKSVIVINNKLITELHSELNKEQKDAKKSGGTLKKAGVLAGVWALFFSAHPLGWLIGGAVALTAGIAKNLKETLNRYTMYQGKDSDNKEIFVMLYDDVNLKLDTIKYPAFVQSVDTKKSVSKIKI